LTLALVVGRGSTVAAAVSAFVVALLLRPVRDRLQNLIDRLFDRRTHDAVRMLHGLSRQVGHEPVQPAEVRDRCAERSATRRWRSTSQAREPTSCWIWTAA